MGSDLLLAYLVRKKRKGKTFGPVSHTDEEVMVAELKRLIDADELGFFEDYVEHCTGNMIRDEIEQMDERFDDRSQVSGLAAMYQFKIDLFEEVSELLHHVATICAGGRRDVDMIVHKGEEIWVTGGMSAGDSPTDACDVFVKFSMLPKSIRVKGGFE